MTIRSGTVNTGEGGIGHATARAFAREDATVVLAGRDLTALADAAKEIGSGRADPVVADVTNASSASRMAGVFLSMKSASTPTAIIDGAATA